MVERSNGPSLGELSRSQARIETVLSRMEQMQEERHEAVLRQVSDVRHRVANLEARESMSKEFFSRVGALFDRVDALEKREIAEQAVGEFKKYLLGGGFLGLVLVGLQIWQIVR